MAGKLTPYTALVFFALGLFLSSFVLNTLVMMKPFVGEPVPFGDYFKKGHALAACGWNSRRHDLGRGDVVRNHLPATEPAMPSPMDLAKAQRWSPRSGACSFGRNSRTQSRARTNSCADVRFVHRGLGIDRQGKHEIRRPGRKPRCSQTRGELDGFAVNSAREMPGRTVACRLEFNYHKG